MIKDLRNTSFIDFSEYKYVGNIYSGSDKKIRIIFDGKIYMIKFAERQDENLEAFMTSYTNYPISEHIGSNIFKSIGIKVQNTILGKYNDQTVVACEDFIRNDDNNNNLILQEFSNIEHSRYDSKDLKRHPDLEHLQDIFENYENFAEIRNDVKSRYWQTFVVDCFIANTDRQSANWGYLLDLRTNKLSLAPVYDCGSSLYARNSDKYNEFLLNNKNLILDTIQTFPAPALRVDNKKIVYLDFMSNSNIKELEKAIQEIIPKIDLNSIHKLIDDESLISDSRKELLKFVLKERYNNILIPAYNKILSKKKKRAK